MTETITLPVDLVRGIVADLKEGTYAHAALTALIPEPDEAQEALAKVLNVMGYPGTAIEVRTGSYPTPVAIIREAMKPKMTPKIAADFRMLRQSISRIGRFSPALDRIEAQFRGEGK